MSLTRLLHSCLQNDGGSASHCSQVFLHCCFSSSEYFFLHFSFVQVKSFASSVHVSSGGGGLGGGIGGEGGGDDGGDGDGGDGGDDGGDGGDGGGGEGGDGGGGEGDGDTSGSGEAASERRSFAPLLVVSASNNSRA